MMVTRGTMGNRKPNPKYMLSMEAREITVPRSPRQALLDSDWNVEMKLEINALKKIKPRLSFHNPQQIIL